MKGTVEDFVEKFRTIGNGEVFYNSGAGFRIVYNDDDEWILLSLVGYDFTVSFKSGDKTKVFEFSIEKNYSHLKITEYFVESVYLMHEDRQFPLSFKDKLFEQWVKSYK